jgi:acetyltransferase
MQLMVRMPSLRAYSTIKGQVLRENTMMLDMCRELGFRIASDPEEPSSMVVTLELSA